MTRTCSQITAFVLTCLACAGANAQVLVSPSLSETKRVEQRPAEPKVATLHRMGQPDPMLRYRLWPAPEDRRDENPAPLVSRALLLSIQMTQETKARFSESYEAWSDLPINDLPRDEVHEVLDRYAAVFNELARAENLMRVDYDLQLDELSAPEMIQTLLPEFQEMRQLGRLLSLRARLAIAEKRWDDVVGDCRLGFRLAEVAGHSTDFLIGRLVGFAISRLMMDIIEEAVEQPECPNLYWALASLPETRLFETRDSIEFESVLMARVFDSVGVLPDYPIGEVAAREKVRTIVHQASAMLSNSSVRGVDEANSRLIAGMYVVTLAEPSRDLLAGTAQWGERSSELSASEAVLRASKLRHERARDRWVAWSMLPPEMWDEYRAEIQAACGADPADSPDILESLIRQLMPAVDAARSAGRRTEQQRNLLISIEAIRMHAEAKAEFPLTTDQLRPVPVWNDAIANKPFGYHRASANRATFTRAARWNGDSETTVHIELKDTK